MRVVVDTNIVFSAILNTNSLIAKILMQSKSNINFYSTDYLLVELHTHFEKLIKLSGLTSIELDKSIALVTTKIRLVDAKFIPSKIVHIDECIICTVSHNDDNA